MGTPPVSPIRLLGRVQATCGNYHQRIAFHSSAPATTPLHRSTPRGFGALAFPNYRLLWGGGLISYTGDWMEQVSLNWLVLSLNGSAWDLGLLNFFRLAPLLALSLIGGVIADRMDRRQLLMRTQIAAMLLSFATAALVYSPWLSLWPLLVLSTLRGALLSFDRPARQSLIPGLVPREHVANAVALHSALRNFTRIFGPSVGGVLIALVGVGGSFLVNAFSFIAVIVALLLMRVPPRKVSVGAHGTLRSGIGEGFKYVRSEPTIGAILLLTLVPMVFGLPYQTLVPVFARDVLDVGSVGYGLLSAAGGVGALIGAIGMAYFGRVTGQGLVLGAFAFGVGLVGFASSPWFALSLSLLVLVGFCNQVYMTTANTLLQSLVPDELRGRVMSIYLMDRGLIPMGSLIAGGLAVVLGAPLTLAAMGAICAGLALAAAPRIAPIRDQGMGTE